MKKKKPMRIKSGSFKRGCMPSDGLPPFVVSAKIISIDPSTNTDILRGYGEKKDILPPESAAENS
jgi:hypothetical protein